MNNRNLPQFDVAKAAILATEIVHQLDELMQLAHVHNLQDNIAEISCELISFVNEARANETSKKKEHNFVRACIEELENMLYRVNVNNSAFLVVSDDSSKHDVCPNRSLHVTFPNRDGVIFQVFSPNALATNYDREQFDFYTVQTFGVDYAQLSIDYFEGRQFSNVQSVIEAIEKYLQ